MSDAYARRLGFRRASLGCYGAMQITVAWIRQRWVWHTSTVFAPSSHVVYYEESQVRKGKKMSCFHGACLSFLPDDHVPYQGPAGRLDSSTKNLEATKSENSPSHRTRRKRTYVSKSWRWCLCRNAFAGVPRRAGRHGGLYWSRLLPGAGSQGVGVTPPSFAPRQFFHPWALCGNDRLDDRDHGKAASSASS